MKEFAEDIAIFRCVKEVKTVKELLDTWLYIVDLCPNHRRWRKVERLLNVNNISGFRAAIMSLMLVSIVCRATRSVKCKRWWVPDSKPSCLIPLSNQVRLPSDSPHFKKAAPMVTKLSTWHHNSDHRSRGVDSFFRAQGIDKFPGTIGFWGVEERGGEGREGEKRRYTHTSVSASTIAAIVKSSSGVLRMRKTWSHLPIAS